MARMDFSRLRVLLRFGLKYCPHKAAVKADDQLSRNEFSEFLKDMTRMYIVGKDKVSSTRIETSRTYHNCINPAHVDAPNAFATNGYHCMQRPGPKALPRLELAQSGNMFAFAMILVCRTAQRGTKISVGDVEYLSQIQRSISVITNLRWR
jgi:hypothetical protein